MRKNNFFVQVIFLSLFFVASLDAGRRMNPCERVCLFLGITAAARGATVDSPRINETGSVDFGFSPAPGMEHHYAVLGVRRELIDHRRRGLEQFSQSWRLSNFSERQMEDAAYLEESLRREVGGLDYQLRSDVNSLFGGIDEQR